MRNLRQYLQTEYQHHSIDRLKEKGIEKGSARWSTLKGRSRSLVNQTNIGTVSRTTLRKLLEEGLGRFWAFPNEDPDETTE